MSYPEVAAALKGGHSTAILLITEQGQQIVSVATPIIYRGEVQGALLLSTRPGVIDEVLQAERNILLGLALTALAATLIASLLLYRTIAGPMRRLSAAAENVSRNIGARAKLPQLAGRTDEVGQMNAAFRTMTESLYRRIEASELFAREVAHELKNPLTAARSTAESLAYAKTPEMRDELVRQIQGELSRLNKLITDVSNVSRLDAELAYGDTEPVDVRDVLRGVMAIFQDRFDDDTLQLVLDIQDRWLPDGSFIVMGHEARLGRVITNLLDNAISFSPEGGVVAVRARRVGGEVEIVVDDDGPGIPPDQLETIFERFYSDRPQSDSTLGKNSGLGLSISRDIVDAYGGQHPGQQPHGRRWRAVQARLDHPALKERRQPGVAGTRFTVRLPAAGAAKPKGAPAACPTRLRSFTAPALPSGSAARCCAAPRAAASPTWPCASCSWRGAARRRIEPPALVADDQVELSRDGGRVLAAAPESIRGKIEVRGVGIVGVKALAAVRAGAGRRPGRARRQWSACRSQTSRRALPASSCRCCGWRRSKAPLRSSWPWRWRMRAAVDGNGCHGVVFPLRRHGVA